MFRKVVFAAVCDVDDCRTAFRQLGKLFRSIAQKRIQVFLRLTRRRPGIHAGLVQRDVFQASRLRI